MCLRSPAKEISAERPIQSPLCKQLFMGRWMLNEACRQLREWHLQGFKQWTVAVNLSAVQFEQSDLLGVVTDAIERHCIAPTNLTIEVTSSVAMRSPETSIDPLEKLTALGVKASIDDFLVPAIRACSTSNAYRPAN